MELFHGSSVIVDQPKIITDGFYKDFGYGFYCTNLEKQAKRWALTKKHGHVVNVYSYTKDDSLNTLVFAQFKKIVALSNLIQRIYHNDIRNMLP